MLLRWIRRRRIRSTSFPAEWETLLRREFAAWRRLGESDRERLRDMLRYFISERYWEGCGGLEIAEQMQVLVAVQASLLLLNRPDLNFSNVSTILLYPSGYFAGPMPTPVLGGPPRVMDGAGTPVLGQAWDRGPVILSWRAAAGGAAVDDDGENVVLHEFAHKIDMMTGAVNGMPPLRSREEARRWHLTLTDASERLSSELQQGIRGPLRPYALTNPAEFFAVTTEVFFERAVALREWDPELYEVFARFYGQDPARR